MNHWPNNRFRVFVQPQLTLWKTGFRKCPLQELPPSGSSSELVWGCGEQARRAHHPEQTRLKVTAAGAGSSPNRTHPLGCVPLANPKGGDVLRVLIVLNLNIRVCLPLLATDVTQRRLNVVRDQGMMGQGLVEYESSTNRSAG
ncbi:conserved hypothetical protein [Culex quinquefasciatus]|uniref:Uncharacterized protein n=1 Tax=Culex quinquefasciatus TaxID=7176 RepID=B0X9S2_CULQU|nr:conserved hypothetical protein [Culex quinquefasciatus]|eukprot:XP_001866394.1 conserved hypothetical protein [Culex quinquefasciatus]